MKFLLTRVVLALGFLITCTSSGFGQRFSTALQGKVIGKQIDSLYLHKVTGDLRREKVTIPVTEGKFKYEIVVHNREAYEIVYPYQHLRGAWKPVTLFVEPGKVQFSLYPETPSKDVIKGGPLNKEFVQFNQEADNKFRNPARKIAKQLEEKTSNNQEVLLLKSKIDSLRKGFVAHHVNYIKKATNPVSYYILYESIENNRFNLSSSLLEKSFQKHAEQLPNHPYTSIIQTTLTAKEQLRVGNKYIDFQAPDLNGNQKKLSNLINSKIALLNLWASWCGPCIRKSRDMVPIYEKFSGEEFIIIGVAREFDNTTRLKKALQREEFPWKNLVDLDDKHNIWRKYDIPFAGGGMFLIGKDGKILAVNPSAKEVQNILNERL